MYKLPELEGLSLDELRAEREKAIEARTKIANLPDDKLTDEALNEFDGIVEAISTVDTAIATAETAEAERNERIERVRAAKAGDEEPEPEAEPEAPQTPEATAEENTPEVVVPDDASELEEMEPVIASARRGAAARAASAAPAPQEPEAPATPKAGIIAAGGISGVAEGTRLDGARSVAEAFQARTKNWARKVLPGESREREVVQPGTLSTHHQRHAVARIEKPATEFSINQGMTVGEHFDAVMAAANEKNYTGGQGIIAAGGWCGPSETLWGGFLTLESAEGLLSIAEVAAPRGGINFTKGPDYSSIYSQIGFMQTEAQAEVGTAKTCYDVECPPFEEVRLDAIGFCIKAGVLTEAAYPEIIDRTLQIAAVAHAHKVNATVISRISTNIGVAVDHVELGSATNDMLDAAALQATRLRYTYSMAPNATVEGVFPLWARELFRADLGRRNGVEMLAVTDQQINAWFAARGVAVQWVYDYQPFTAALTTPAAGAAWTSFPDVVEFMMYPAGSYVKLGTPVIDLDTIYDSVGLSTNTFTAAFFEEGVAVANTGADGVKVSVTVTDLYGRTGAAELAPA